MWRLINSETGWTKPNRINVPAEVDPDEANYEVGEAGSGAGEAGQEFNEANQAVGEDNRPGDRHSDGAGRSNGPGGGRGGDNVASDRSAH